MGYRGPYAAPAKTPYGITIAAADSDSRTKRWADYVCDGTADEVTINNAIGKLTSGSSVTGDKSGGAIYLAPGQYELAAPIVIDRAISFLGMTSNSPELTFNSSFDSGSLPKTAIYLKTPTLGGSSRALNRIGFLKILGDLTAGDQYGIYQVASVSGHIDCRIEDIWFQDIGEYGIVLNRFWNHRITRCTFESSAGYENNAILFNGDATDGYPPKETLITGCYSQSCKHFIGVAGSGDMPNKISAIGNILRTTEEIMIPGEEFTFAHNTIQFSPAADNTKSCIKGLGSQHSSSVRNVNITGNTFLSTSHNPHSIINLEGVGSVAFKNFAITNNVISDAATIGAQTAAIYITSNSAYMVDGVISGNIINSKGIGVSGTKLGSTNITGNQFDCAGHAFTTSGSGGKNNFDANDIISGTIGTIGITDRIGNGNGGFNERITASTAALTTFGFSQLHTSANDIAATLADGVTPGQRKHIYMTDATEAGDGGTTVTVATHETSSPEVGTFDAEGEYWILEWTGTMWITIAATCAF